MNISRPDAASFRDPDGFVFYRDGELYRQVNQAYQADFDQLMTSGLYDELVQRELLVAHETADPDLSVTDEAFRILKPEAVPFVSYPYEWSFSQLRDAALTTLTIQRKALAAGMSLKDASAYNIQFLRGRPLLIDTLSFERYREGQPWIAYRQFCEHFLAPLAVMSYTDVRLGRLLQVYMDGIPLDLAARLLPFRARLSFSILTHIVLHPRSQRRYAGADIGSLKHKMSLHALTLLIDNLEGAIGRLRWRPRETGWTDYYRSTNYSSEARRHKERLVERFVRQVEPSQIWDLGANTGLFSRAASHNGALTVAFDMDPSVVERNYRECVRNGEKNILPLLLDLTNPSPDCGWDNRERKSLLKRSPCELAMALALIHHLAIANNIPLDLVARFLGGICRWLIIEFVPKSDSQTQRLLASREDIFPRYTSSGFEEAFGKVFSVHARERIEGSQRTLYLMKKR